MVMVRGAATNDVCMENKGGCLQSSSKVCVRTFFFEKKDEIWIPERGTHNQNISFTSILAIASGNWLKPGFHMIVRIIRIVPVVSKNFQAIGTIIWKHIPDDRRRSQTTRTIGTITIVRIAHDRGDREKSEAIKWKHSQTIEVYPRKHHSRHHFSRFRVKNALEFANFHQNGGNVGAQLFFIYGRGTEIRVPVQQIFKGF